MKQNKSFTQVNSILGIIPMCINVIKSNGVTYSVIGFGLLLVSIVFYQNIISPPSPNEFTLAEIYFLITGVTLILLGILIVCIHIIATNMVNAKLIHLELEADKKRQSLFPKEPGLP